MKISRGWKVHNNITDDDINVLKTALSELIGVEYEPKNLSYSERKWNKLLFYM